MNSKAFQKKFTFVLLIYTCVILCIWVVYNSFVYLYNQNTIYENMESEAERMLATIDSELSQIKVGASLIGSSPYVKDFLTEEDISAYYERSAGVNEIIAKVMGVNAIFDQVVTVNESGDFYRFVGSLGNETITILFNEFVNGDPTFRTLMLEGVGYFCYITPVFSNATDNPERIGSIMIANSLARTRRMLEQGKPADIDTSVVAGEKILLSTERNLDGRGRAELYESHDFFAEKQVRGTHLSVIVSAVSDRYMAINTAFVTVSLLIVLLFLGSVLTLHRYLSKNMLYPLLSTKDKMQMGLLGRQMDAHFVVNTLKNVEILIKKEETQSAQRIMNDLCDLLKHQQRGACNVFIEIKVLERYIEIMNTRHNKRYAVDMDIDEELVNYVMPAFVLQPILENAFVHGGAEKKEGFRVEISGAIRDERIVFKIADNGAGIAEPELGELQEALGRAHMSEYPKEGLGGVALINIQKRIVSQYGRKFGLSVQSEEGEGTTVTVLLPLLPDASI